jgi:ABC-type transport system substrate-binding protein
MSQRHRTSGIAFAALVAALEFAAGCGPRAAMPRPHAVWVLGVDAPVFDPDGPPDARRAALERLLTRGLVEEDSTGRIVPVAAERIEVSPDSLLYTFHVRRDLQFVDGTPCRSDVFRDALRAGLARADHSTRRWQLAAVRGVDAIRAGRPLPPLGIETPDSLTLGIRLVLPDRRLLARLAIPGTTTAWKRRDVASWREAVGLGPLQVMHADSTRSLELAKARSPFARADLADTLTVRFVPVAARVRALLRVGRPDLVWPLPPGLLSEPVPAGYRRVVQSARPERWLLLVMRADLPPTTRLPARHALGHGINRTELMRTLAPRVAEVGAWIPGAPPFDFPRLDPQEIELWRERGKLGRSFHVVMAYDAQGPAAEVARRMQGEWAVHSIYVELRPLTGIKRQAEFLAGRAQLVLADVQDPASDPAALLATLVMPYRGPAVGAVRTGWRTRDFDPWLGPSRREAPWDPGWVERRLEEERVVLPLARLPWVWLERAAGPVAPFHPRYGPECPTPSFLR